MATKLECDLCSEQVERGSSEGDNWFEIYSTQAGGRPALQFNYCSLTCLEEGARKLQLEYPHLS